MTTEIVCDSCGVKVPKTGHNQRYCAECWKRLDRERRRKLYKSISVKKKRGSTEVKSIEEIVREATEAGMSYGMYVAKMMG